PADPQQSGTDHRERQIVRREIIAAVTAPRAEHQSGDQTRDAGIEMHDGAAGEIEHAGAAQKAAAPDPMGDRHIDDQEPQRREPQKRMRSATEPATSATVMTANVIW